MTLHQELPRLLDELAGSRPVGDPPELGDRTVAESRSRRSPRGPMLAAAACIAALLAGLVVAAGRGDRAATDVVWTPPDEMAVRTWVAVPELPIAARFQHAAVATDRGVLVWGGCCEADSMAAPDSTAFHDGAYLDLALGRWRTLPDAPLDPTRGDALAAWNGSEVIVLNGLGRIRAAAFDPGAFTWRSITPPAGESAASATARLFPMPDGRVVFVTTVYEDGIGNGVRIQTYDPTADTWTAAAEPRAELSYGVSLPSAIHGAAVAGSSVAVLSSARPGCGTADVDVYDTTTGGWRTFDRIAHPDADWVPSALVGIDGRRFVIVGGPCDGGPQRLGVVLDADDGSTTAISDAPVELRGGFRYDLTWTGRSVVGLNGDGRLLAYDPALERWSVSDPIPASAGEAPAEMVDGVPIVWIDDTVFVPAIATGIDGGVCCRPIPAGWAYRPG